MVLAPPNTLLLRHEAKRSLLFCENSQYLEVMSQIADSKPKVITAVVMTIFFDTAFPDLLDVCNLITTQAVENKSIFP